MVRSAYSTACRWYAGGPIGRIRYYFVPPSNQILFKENVFWPSTEILSDFNNVNDPGEIAGQPRAWDRGTNFRPDLVGDEPDGSDADFLGKTPYPSLPPVLPDCVPAPDLQLPLEIRAAIHPCIEPYGEFNLQLTFNARDLTTCNFWWHRSDELESIPDGGNVLLWPDVGGGGYHSTGSGAGLLPTKGTLDNGRAGAGCIFYRLSTQFRESTFLTTVPLLSQHSISFYVVALSSYNPGSLHWAFGGPGPIQRTLRAHAPGVQFSDSDNLMGATLGAFDPTVPQIYSVRRWPDHAEIKISGQRRLVQGFSASGVTSVNGFGCEPNLSIPFTADGGFQEIMLYCHALSDQQDADIIGYLKDKYSIT